MKLKWRKQKKESMKQSLCFFRGEDKQNWEVSSKISQKKAKKDPN